MLMDEKLVIAVVAAGSALVGGLVSAVVAPIIKHRLEQSAVEKSFRREQIKGWRDMVLQIDRESDGDINVGPALQVHPDFLSLEPHLSDEVRRSVYSNQLAIVVGQTMAKPLRQITGEISRIEKEWQLR